MGDDRDRHARGTIDHLRRWTDLRRPPVEKFRMFRGKVAIDHDANVYPTLIVSGKALAFGFWADGEQGKLVVFQIFLFLEEERQAQPRP